MPNTKDMPIAYRPIKILVYGPPKVGKTLFAATFTDSEKSFIIDTERGLTTLRGLDREYETVLEHDRTRPTAFRRVRELILTKSKDMDENDTLVIDSLSVVNDYAFYEAQRIMNSINKSPTFDEWRQTLQFMLDLCDLLISLKCNVVCTAHEDLTKDESLGILTSRPYFSGQSQVKIPYKFDEVYKLSINAKREHIITTHGDLRTQAGSRLNRCGVIETSFTWVWSDSKHSINPVYERILEAESINKGGKKDA
ncbi:MAG: AAA family ATPase [Nitrososphaerota archaeon]